ncbi:hypothetical protein H8R18_00260 [Nanchangia anserum]|uniref:choice-of-anchor M domain-containing protein n=1 Tax=Nanchangia anserum TaxID=2692125 RepID=UPI00188453F9|nr:choice-of-anchor M domain-containing protein [Nanchangia anserum]QOX81858.1 hypothetical protein H8R18_00260 [Nanchangia anserum]
MTPRKFLATTATLLVAIATIVAGGGASARADSPASLVSSDHKPGVLRLRERVPADLKLPDGTPHPCAGRYLIYRDHVDPIYLTKSGGKPTMMVVAGSAVVPANSVCLRLGPDSSGGRETSRMVVPKDSSYAFLGKPGRILWYAPFTRADNNSPLWAGVGAFDPEHELSQPDIPDHKVTLSLEDFAGPGRMNVFIDAAMSPAKQIINSADPLYHSTQLQPGGHAHMSFAFTKPGIYHTHWSGSYIEGANVPQHAAATDVIWLVGTNADAGLPKDFPREYSEPSTSAEMMRDAMGLSDPHDDDDGIQGGHSKTPGPPPAGATGVASVRSQMEFGASWDEDTSLETADPVNLSGDDDGNVRIGNHPGKTALFLDVDDSPNSLACLADTPENADLGRALPTGWLWATGRGGHPAVTIDVAHLPGIDTSHPVSVLPSLDASDENRVHAWGKWNGQTFSPIARSDSGISGEFSAPANTPIVFDLAFNAPGMYSDSVDITYTRTDGSSAQQSIPFYTVVGNSSINEFHRIIGKTANLPQDSRAGETCAAHPDPKPDPTPNPMPEPTPHPDPSQPTPTGEKLCPARVALGHRAPAVVTAGHMDMGPDAHGNAVVVDTADPAHPRTHASGTVAFTVPDPTHDLSALTGADKEITSLGKAWYIPQTQENDRPWVGISTQHLGTPTRAGVSLTMTPRVMPAKGRVIVGQGGSVMTPWQTFFDSAKPELRRLYREPVHEHPATFFTQPGIYVLDYTYRWIDAASGDTHATTMRATYAVGTLGRDQLTQLGTPLADPHACDGTSIAGPISGDTTPTPAPAPNPGTPSQETPTHRCARRSPRRLPGTQLRRHHLDHDNTGGG